MIYRTEFRSAIRIEQVINNEDLGDIVDVEYEKEDY